MSSGGLSIGCPPSSVTLGQVVSQQYHSDALPREPNTSSHLQDRQAAMALLNDFPIAVQDVRHSGAAFSRGQQLGEALRGTAQVFAECGALGVECDHEFPPQFFNARDFNNGEPLL